MDQAARLVEFSPRFHIFVDADGNINIRSQDVVDDLVPVIVMSVEVFGAAQLMPGHDIGHHVIGLGVFKERTVMLGFIPREVRARDTSIRIDAANIVEQGLPIVQHLQPVGVLQAFIGINAADAVFIIGISTVRLVQGNVYIGVLIGTCHNRIDLFFDLGQIILLNIRIVGRVWPRDGIQIFEVNLDVAATVAFPLVRCRHHIAVGMLQAVEWTTDHGIQMRQATEHGIGWGSIICQPIEEPGSSIFDRSRGLIEVHAYVG